MGLFEAFYFIKSKKYVFQATNAFLWKAHAAVGSTQCWATRYCTETNDHAILHMLRLTQ